MKHFLFTMQDGKTRAVIAHTLKAAIQCGRIKEVPRSVVIVGRKRFAG